MTATVTVQSRTFFVLRHDTTGGTAQGIMVRRGEWRVERPGVGAPRMSYGSKAQAVAVATAELEREADDLDGESVAATGNRPSVEAAALARWSAATRAHSEDPTDEHAAAAMEAGSAYAAACEDPEAH